MPDIIEVSIIIPCRNEEKFIGKCLDSIVSQNYPKKKLEVMVIDGRSEDRTREVVEEYTERYPFIKLLDNPKKIRPAALNIGIKQAKGSIIMRMDAHSALEINYATRCKEFLSMYDADVVGGRTITFPQKNTFMGKAIAVALSHPFGVGTSYFRIGSKEPRWVDTVFCGCYKKEVFEKVGLWDERIELSEDMSYNISLRQAGFKILLVPEIVNYYWARSDFGSFCKHNFRNGVWVVLPFKYASKPISLRHLVPLAFVSSLFGSGILSVFFSIFFKLFLLIIFSYFIFNLYFSVNIALREKEFRYLFLMPFMFIILHIGYGLGSIWGLFSWVFLYPFRKKI